MEKRVFLIGEDGSLSVDYINDFSPEFIQIQELIECECFDVFTGSIGNKIYDLYVDDIGKILMKDPTAYIFIDGTPVDYLCGNILILSHGLDGESDGLKLSDIENIQNHIIMDFLIVNGD